MDDPAEEYDIHAAATLPRDQAPPRYVSADVLTPNLPAPPSPETLGQSRSVSQPLETAM